MKNKSFLFHYYCKTNYSPLGFRRTKGCYSRIVHDVYQAFSIHFFPGSSPICTIRFSVRPLCERIAVPFSEDYDLFDLDLQSRWEREGWNVCPAGGFLDYSEVFAEMELRLLPLFQKANSCSNALTELSRIEVEIEANRLGFLLYNEIPDMAESFSHRSLLSESKLFMALKSNNYEYAAEALEVFMAKLDNFRPSYQEEIKKLAELIERKDRTAIDSILLKNEQYSREQLKALGIKEYTGDDSLCW